MAASFVSFLYFLTSRVSFLSKFLDTIINRRPISTVTFPSPRMPLIHFQVTEKPSVDLSQRRGAKISRSVLKILSYRSITYN